MIDKDVVLCSLLQYAGCPVVNFHVCNDWCVLIPWGIRVSFKKDLVNFCWLITL